MISAMRFVLSAAAVAVIYVDPLPARYLIPAHAALTLYALYSAILYVLSQRPQPLVPVHITHWLDAAWYTLLIGLSGGTSSVFFFFFFFCILVASFRWGYATGLRVVAASTILFTLVGVATAPPEPEFELSRALLRPVYLLVLGYMMAYWGGYEVDLRRRMKLLRDVGTLSNPRFGVGHLTVSILRHVRAFYNAEACLLLLLPGAWDERDEFRLIQVTRRPVDHDRGDGDDAGEDVTNEHVPSELASQFLTLPETLSVVFNARTRPWHRTEPRHFSSDHSSDGCAEADSGECEALAAILDAEAFVSVPMLHRGRAAGRIFLAGRRGAFGPSDVDFIHQIIEHVMPVLDNVRLLERLAARAAETERERIARDLHDSVIQPYIGLQYKLAAVRGKLEAGGRSGEVSDDIRRLFDVTVSEIGGLRRYVSGLKGGRGDELAAAILRYTEQFQENYGIGVSVSFRGEAHVPERLAAEVIQMVHEGLRNVWKHTAAAHCSVVLDASADRLLLSIENDNAEGAEGIADFTPRSITERAEALGGRATVACDGRGRTIVVVRVPL